MSGDGPVYEAVLRLGDVTVLTGPNDSGKTRVLRFIEEGLMGPDYPDYLGVEVEVFGSRRHRRSMVFSETATARRSGSFVLSLTPWPCLRLGSSCPHTRTGSASGFFRPGAMIYCLAGATGGR